jgi:hypothetical protein
LYLTISKEFGIGNVSEKGGDTVGNERILKPSEIERLIDGREKQKQENPVPFAQHVKPTKDFDLNTFRPVEDKK